MIKGKETGMDVIEGADGPVHCFMHGMAEAWFMPLNLSDYMDLTITVAGEHRGNTLYRAQIVQVPELQPGRNPEKEAKTLNDLLRIRAANRQKIEAVNGNLGTALGFKWSNNQKTDHPCIIIFVPQKVAPWLVPNKEKAPEFLETTDGIWCMTDIVLGGKASSLDEISPLPDLSEKNTTIIQELKSGRIGLVGGIQLAFFGNGTEDNRHAFVGTAGIAVRHRETQHVGFLTNQHVAEVPGRQMFHPWHKFFRLGKTNSVKEFESDENWYKGVIDETNSYVRCDCGFIEVDDCLSDRVVPGLHFIGTSGDPLRINPDTMDIIGQKVISIGRTRGVQRGTIAAYAYEFHDEFLSICTDLLIIGEEGKAFSWKGDSGKLIVTDDEKHRVRSLCSGEDGRNAFARDRNRNCGAMRLI